MPRTLSNEHRSELFDIASDLENPIGDLQSFVEVLRLIADGMNEKTDAAAIHIITNELDRRGWQLSEMHGKLFHGLHVDPRAPEEILADADLAKNARAS